MKRIVIIASAYILLSACNQSASTSTGAVDSSTTNIAATTSSQQLHNMQVAMDGVKAFPTGNVDETFKNVVQNSIDYGDGTTPVIKGLDSIKAADEKVMKDWKSAFPDMQVDNLTATANGDTVMVWGDYTGTWKGDFMEQKPTGKSFRVAQVDYFIFNDAGKIVEHRMTPNGSEIARQIGIK